MMTAKIIIFSGVMYLTLRPKTCVMMESNKLMFQQHKTCTSKILTPPQFRVLARSLPVPRGRTATGGGG